MAGAAFKLPLTCSMTYALRDEGEGAAVGRILFAAIARMTGVTG